MPENKTKETEASVRDFIDQVESAQKRLDSHVLIEILKEISGFEPKMWGPSIIGFGSYHYKYQSGHEGDAPLIGFSPRKNAISLYFSCDVNGEHPELLAKLGKFKTGKGCLYVNKLSDVDIEILKALAKDSIKITLEKYP
ncbi:DUF1801 domain-containing protein [Cyclobacteriaceae bacterium YHN15]|nr:DUF1801 domain-containing protein [Cyclobacteriaceae bacterium YHN15]